MARIGRPRGPTHGYVRSSFSVSPENARFLEWYCEEHGETLGGVLEKLINMLKNQPKVAARWREFQMR